MTASRSGDKPGAFRASFGPRPLGTVIPQVTRAAFRKTAPAIATLLTDWADIVGPALASSTRPVRLAAGTLTIGCHGAVALELQHVAGALVERLNVHAGHPIVQRLRFVQQAVSTPSPLAPGKVRRPPRIETQPLDSLPEGGLRAALEALARWIPGDPP